MLLKQEVLDGIVDGRITRVFRNWKRPTVKTGGTLNTSVGQLVIEAVDVIAPSKLTGADAKAAGLKSLKELRESLRPGEDRQLYRVTVRYGGADPRLALRDNIDLAEADVEELSREMHRMNTSITDPRLEALELLRMLSQNEAVRAPDLAERLGVETKWFKTRIRRLKTLGLTESLRVGYRVSPRGHAVLGSLTD